MGRIQELQAKLEKGKKKKKKKKKEEDKDKAEEFTDDKEKLHQDEKGVEMQELKHKKKVQGKEKETEEGSEKDTKKEKNEPEKEKGTEKWKDKDETKEKPSDTKKDLQTKDLPTKNKEEEHAAETEEEGEKEAPPVVTGRQEPAGLTPEDVDVMRTERIKYLGAIVPKSGDTETKRFIAEEGLYEARKPFVTKHNLEMMEQRLRFRFEDERYGELCIAPCVRDRVWLSEGNVIRSDDPLRRLVQRYIPHITGVRYFRHRFVLPTQEYLQLASDGKVFLLDLHLAGVQFHDHPLFIEEDLLCSQLHLLYACYLERQEQNLAHFFEQKMEVLQGCIDSMDPSNPSLRQLHRYLRKVRRAKDEEANADIQLVNKMFAVWSRLKKVRQRQNFSSTKLKVTFKKVFPDYDKDIADLDRDVEIELAEVQERYEAEYANALETYKHKKELWEKRKAADHEEEERPRIVFHEEKPGDRDSADEKGQAGFRRRAVTNRGQRDEASEKEDEELGKDEESEGDDETKRLRPTPRLHPKRADRSRRRSPTSKTHGDVQQKGKKQPRGKEDSMHQGKSAQEVMDEYTLAQTSDEEDDVEEPTPPVFHPFNQDAAKAEIEKLLLDNRRQPGEAFFVPSLSYSHHITDSANCPPEEMARRERIRRTHVHTKIFINGRHVTSSSEKPIRYASHKSHRDFSVHLGDIFPIQVLRWPESAQLKLFSQADGDEELVTTIPLTIPVIETRATPQRVQFRSAHAWQCHWEASPPSAVGEDATKVPPDGRAKRTLRAISGGYKEEQEEGTKNASRHFTSGTVGMCLQWGRDPSDGSSLAPPIPPGLSQQQQALAGFAKQPVRGDVIVPPSVGSRRLKEWIGNVADPNDPRNTNVQHLLGDDAATSADTSFLRVQPELLLVSAAAGQYSNPLPRQQLLRLRSEGKYPARQVPLLPADIPTTVEQTASLTTNLAHLGVQEPPLSRAEVALQEKIAVIVGKLKIMEKPKKKELKLEDVITVDTSESPLLPIIRSFFKGPYRPLNPIREEQEPAIVMPTKVTLLVRVLGAELVPARRNAATMPPPPNAAPTTQQQQQRMASVSASVSASSAFPLQQQQQQHGAAPTVSLQQYLNMEDESDTPSDMFQNVYPYFQVEFDNKTYRTRTVQGATPMWNETIAIPVDLSSCVPPSTAHTAASVLNAMNTKPGTASSSLSSPPDPDAVEQLQKTVFLTLFDEVVVSLEDDDRERNLVHRRMHGRVLGTYAVSWATLMQERVGGKVAIRCPLVSLGYSRSHLINVPVQANIKPTTAPGTSASMALSASQTLSASMAVNASSTIAAHLAPVTAPGTTFSPPVDVVLSLQMIIDPPLAFLSPDTHDFDLLKSSEDEPMCQYATSWLAKLNNLHPERDYQPFFVDVAGKLETLNVAVTPQTPPQSCAEAQFVRFVSLIPLKRAYPGLLQRIPIMLTSQQVLELGHGDWLEHACLLCSYYLSAGTKEAWVVVGTSSTEGRVAYVLTRDTTTWLYTYTNPITGRSCTIRKPPHPPPVMPLTDVHLVFNNVNVYANLQAPGPMNELNMHFKSTLYWAPFLARNPHLPDCPPFQEKVLYKITPRRYVNQVQRHIEKTLMDTFETARRSRFTTHWNRTCNRILAELVDGCEEQHLRFVIEPELGGRQAGQQAGQQPVPHKHKHHPPPPVSTAGKAGDEAGPMTPEEVHVTALGKLFALFPNLEGYPLNMPYTSVDDVCAAVLRTGMHLREDRLVEYACAVRVVPYPCRVLSVWVYMALLQRSAHER
eukprot:TRINITY_DN398_c0_g1_i3.p1 TRINITY_DN398_c0_g1~~TRINITY_DN398_c0_g1_i3.p1  ORF type:complete len:1766 (-),score=437.07 TRINITY_DN398_c0_g1_i3:70-5367(-)